MAKLGVAPEDLAAFRYRGDGWPGYATATRRDGSAERMSYNDSWGDILTRHVQFRCKICPDGVGRRGRRRLRRRLGMRRGRLSGLRGARGVEPDPEPHGEGRGAGARGDGGGTARGRSRCRWTRSPPCSRGRWRARGTSEGGWPPWRCWGVRVRPTRGSGCYRARWRTGSARTCATLPGRAAGCCGACADGAERRAQSGSFRQSHASAATPSTSRHRPTQSTVTPRTT